MDFPQLRLLTFAQLALIACCWTPLIVDGEEIDITAGGTASQTTEWNGGQFPAANAIDGNAATFSHSDANTANNAWQLDFASHHEISRVELTMRSDCCGGRLSGTTLRLFGDEGDSVYDAPITDPGQGQAAVFDLPPGIVVRSLRVGFENGATNPGGSTTLVHLGEVRVFSEVDLLPAIDSFVASPNNIAAGGGSTLSWQTGNADSVELLGIGAVNAVGSLGVSPAASELFTLVATNANGSRSASLAVLVDGQLLAPRINEFMAANNNTIVRSDGSTPDWIEIWNPNPVALDLTGHRLSDDVEQPARFVFPAMSLAAGGYLVIDAAAASLDGVAATGFALDRSGGSILTLFSAGGESLQTITYPDQRADVSYGLTADGAKSFFLNPTPGEANVGGGVGGFVADTQFSVKRGFYDSPQSVAITSKTAGATIYLTTDGSEPGPENPSADVYTNPLSISTTTVLRAAAYLDGFQPTDVDTQTYIFPADVASQSSSPANFPLAWVPNLNGVQAAVPALSHFGMNASVLGSLPLLDADGQSFDLAGGLTAIPTMSLVLDADVLFDPVDGLHINAQSRGRNWERPASIEFIDPQSGDEIQANCGLRMHGGWNRFPEMLKKSFRLYFRSEYGDSKFKFPIFPQTGLAEVDRILLRSGNGKSWASPWRALSGGGNSLERNTYMRDQFVRDLQAATGNPHVPGRFVHLYINGHYWGLYNPVERPDEHFAAARFGGVDDDYDVIKWQRGVGHRVAAGDDVGWNALIALARGNTADPATYAAIGDLLDLPGFVDYMLVNFFSGNSDWIDNNVYAMRNRAADGAFRFFCWDSEESFLSVGADVSGRQVADTCTEIHRALRSNADYRQLFADRAQKHLFNGGALTKPVTDAILAAHAAVLDRAIVGDSARWGDLFRPANPYDRADWLGEVTNLRNNYLGQRVGITINQLRADNLFPDVAAPTFSPQRGGSVELGSGVVLESAAGEIYFTTDGSDPRSPGGGVSPGAMLFDGGSRPQELVTLGSGWDYLANGSDLGSSDVVVGTAAYGDANWKHADFDDSAWSTGVAPLGYGAISGTTIATVIDYGPDGANKYTTSYFRKRFEVADASSVLGLQLRLMRDDGAVIYLNGHEVVRSAFPAGTTKVTAATFALGVSGAAEGTLLDFVVPPGLLVEGANQLALELHQESAGSSDLGFDLELVADVAIEGGLIVISDDTLLRARVRSGGVWSAVDEAFYTVGDRGTDLYVSEIMYHPPVGGAEFLEIANRGSVTHLLRGLKISGGIQFDFSSSGATVLAPGDRLILVRDAVAFEAAYPGVAHAGVYVGALGNGGDTFSLESSEGSILWKLSYSDGAPWPGGADGHGRSLIYVRGDQNVAASWRPSATDAGNPGATDELPLVPGDDWLAYAIAGQSMEITALGEMDFHVTRVLGADALSVQPEWSSDLQTWSSSGFSQQSQTPTGGGKADAIWRLEPPAGLDEVFVRNRLTLP